MRLSRHAFARFWDAHAWLGVTAGLALHSGPVRTRHGTGIAASEALGGAA